jgi:hypothetical protein
LSEVADMRAVDDPTIVRDVVSFITGTHNLHRCI